MGISSQSISKQTLIALYLKWIFSIFVGIRHAFIKEEIQKEMAEKSSREILTF